MKRLKYKLKKKKPNQTEKAGEVWCYRGGKWYGKFLLPTQALGFRHAYYRKYKETL